MYQILCLINYRRSKRLSITTNEKVPEWADEKVKTRVDEIQDEIDRLIEEGPIKTGSKSDMRRVYISRRTQRLKR